MCSAAAGMKKPRQATRPDGAIDWVKQNTWNVEFAKRELLERGEITPMFVLHTPSGLLPIVTDMGDKQRIRAMVQLMCVAHDAMGLTFIGEAWMKYADENDAPRPGETLAELEQRIVPPSELERRIEVITVVTQFYTETGDRRVITSLREILRGADGKPTGLNAEVPVPHGADFQGPAAEILPERRATPAMQQAAKQLLDAIGVEPLA